MGLAQIIRQEGRQEGQRQGWHGGEANILRRQLTRRFGALPEWAERKLAEAAPEQLELWGDCILDAPTLEAVFQP